MFQCSTILHASHRLQYTAVGANRQYGLCGGRFHATTVTLAWVVSWPVSQRANLSLFQSYSYSRGELTPGMVDYVHHDSK